MLHRVVYSSQTVGSVGASTLSVAQILGVSDRNNRRDHLTSAIAFHDGHALQAIEGARTDVDRLLRKLGEDPRIGALTILIDRPIQARAFDEPMSLCPNPQAMLKAMGHACLSLVSGNDVERLVDKRLAA